MNKNILLLPLLAVVFALPKKARAQEPANERKISIEITTTENGSTTTKNIDLENATDAEIEDALKEMGIMDHFVINGDEENIVIDIRRFGSGENDQDVRMRIAPPMPPVPPMPPSAAQSEKYTWLGVTTEKVNDELAAEKGSKVKDGVYILEVMDGSPAGDAGLKVGDVITAVDGKNVADPKALSDAIRAKAPGEKVKVTYHREGKKSNTTAMLAERKSTSFSYGYGNDHDRQWKQGRGGIEGFEGPRAFLGVTPGEGDGDIKGAVIGTVEEGSAAEKMGLHKGDIIRSVNDEAIESFSALSRKIRSMAPGDPVKLAIERNGALQKLSGELGEKKSAFQFDIPEDFQFEMKGFDETERENLRKDMEKLQEEMEKLREDLGRDLRSETRISIESRKLTDEEKQILKNKGVKGLENELELADLRTFPNPSDGFFRIHFDVSERGDLSVDVHDASGERVYQEKITDFKGRYERTLDLSDKASGSYFLVISQNGQAMSRKLVKQ